MLEASIVVIGDEILGGFVQDTNSGWLASRVGEHGVELSRIVTVPDDESAIAEALHTELDRSRPRVIFTTGGVGSTPDDVTYESVAAALDRELVEVPEIARWITGAVAWTASFGLDAGDAFTDAMMRMARVPAGATLLDPRGGFAPGVRVDVDGGSDAPGGASVVILPGVPSQLRTIVDRSVVPQLLAGRGTERAVTEVEHGYPESVLNPVFAQLADEHPEVKVGSYPGVPMLVRLRGPKEAVEAAHATLTGALDELDASEGGARLRAAWATRLGRATEDGT